MSHFTVLVVGNHPETQLLPYQEDAPQEYLVFVDKEEEYLQEYNTGTVKMVKDSTGKLVYSHKINGKIAPEEIKEIPFKKHFSTFEEYMSEWHDMTDRNKDTNKYGYYTNPNARWDWFEIGGRWDGFFKIKATNSVLLEDSKLETLELTQKEFLYISELYYLQDSRLTSELDKYPKRKQILEAVKKAAPPEYEGGHTQAQCVKANIDFEWMEQLAIEQAKQQYTAAMEIFGDSPPNKSWEECYNQDPTTAKEKYWGQERCKKWQAAETSKFGWSTTPDKYLMDRPNFLEKAKNQTATTFAIVKDGQWIEKGNMGWFGMVSNESETWTETFHRILREIPDETLLTIVDCHI